MDILVREAVDKYLENGTLNETVLPTADRRKSFRKLVKFCEMRQERVFLQRCFLPRSKLTNAYKRSISECLGSISRAKRR